MPLSNRTLAFLDDGSGGQVQSSGRLSDRTLSLLGGPEDNEPSYLGRAWEGIKGIGSAIEQAPTIAAGYYAGAFGGPSEYRRKALSPIEEPVPIREMTEQAFGKPVAADELDEPSYLGAVGRRVGGVAGELLTSPTNAAILLATGGASGLAGPLSGLSRTAIPDLGSLAASGLTAKAALAAGDLVPEAATAATRTAAIGRAAQLGGRGLSLGFAAQMIPGAAEQLAGAFQKYQEEGFSPQVAAELAGGTLEAAMAAGALHHGLAKTKPLGPERDMDVAEPRPVEAPAPVGAPDTDIRQALADEELVRRERSFLTPDPEAQARAEEARLARADVPLVSAIRDAITTPEAPRLGARLPTFQDPNVTLSPAAAEAAGVEAPPQPRRIGPEAQKARLQPAAGEKEAQYASWLDEAQRDMGTVQAAPGQVVEYPAAEGGKWAAVVGEDGKVRAAALLDSPVPDQPGLVNAGAPAGVDVLRIVKAPGDEAAITALKDHVYGQNPMASGPQTEGFTKSVERWAGSRPETERATLPADVVAPVEPPAGPAVELPRPSAEGLAAPGPVERPAEGRSAEAPGVREPGPVGPPVEAPGGSGEAPPAGSVPDVVVPFKGKPPPARVKGPAVPPSTTTWMEYDELSGKGTQHTIESRGTSKFRIEPSDAPEAPGTFDIWHEDAPAFVGYPTKAAAEAALRRIDMTGELPESPPDQPPPKPRGPAKVLRFDGAAALERMKRRGGESAAFDIGAAVGEGAGALRDAAIYGASLIERGIRSFPEWSKAMTEGLGAIARNIGKHLENLWAKAQELFAKKDEYFGPSEAGAFAPKTGVSGKGPAPTPGPAPAKGPVPHGRTGGPTTTPSVTPPAATPPRATSGLNVAEESRLDALTRTFQDRMVRGKRYTEAAEKAGTLTEANNFYRAEELFHGKTEEAFTDAKTKFAEPLVKTLGQEGLSLDQLGDYLKALDAPNRNAEINRRWKGQRPDGSGWSDAKASQVLADLKAKGLTPKLDKAVKIVRAMRDEQMRVLEDSGLMSREQVQAWRDTWGDTYVPWRHTDIEKGPGTGSGYDIRGPESKSATGRSASGKQAENPAVHMMAQLARSIVRAEKNRVAQSFAEFVKDNPDSAVWEMDVKHTKSALDDDGLVHRVKDEEAYDKDYDYKVDGKTKRITIKDQLLLRAMKNMGAAETGGFLRKVGTFTRLYSGLVTSWSPEFLFTNPIRDVQAALGNVSAEHGGKIAASMVKNIPQAMAGMYKSLRNPGATGKWATLAKEFREDGGSSGFYEIKDVPTLEKQLSRAVSLAGPGALKAAGRSVFALKDMVENANKSVENGTRLAIYSALRDAGASRAKAASVAKNATLNFSRKGEVGPAINALYAFFNANVQGIARLKQVVVDNPKGRAIAAGIVGLGATMDMYNRAHAGDANKDGSNDYDDIPEYVKEKNLVFMRGEGKAPILFPMPYGFNVLHSVGRLGAAASQGAIKPLAAATGAAGALVNAFNPLGGEADIVQMLSPTALDPVVQHVMNRDFTGKPIHPEQFPTAPKKPDSEVFFKNVSPVWRKTAELINRASGGDKVTPGFISPHADVLEHYWNFATGGIGRFGSNLLATGESVAKGETPSIRKIPVARRFVYEERPGAQGQKFQANVEELDTLAARFEQYRKDGNREGMTGIPRALLRAKRSVDSIETQIRSLRKALKARPDLQKRIEQLELRGNRIVADARRAT